MSNNEQNEILLMLGEMKGDIKALLVETKRTNGRVTKLEDNFTTIRVSDGIQNTKLGLIATAAGAVGSLILSHFK